MEDKQIWELLRPYQREAVEVLLQRPRMCNFDDMGLGKTLTTLAALELRHVDLKERVVIFCPGFALYVWAYELERWFQRTSVVYAGTPKRREQIWKTFVKGDSPYLITTYGMKDEVFNRTKSFDWYAVVADEIHTSAAGLLKHTNTSYISFEKYARDVEVVNPLTGTPVRQGVLDLYAPLHIVNRYKHHNYYAFINRWCNTIVTPFGKEIDRRPKDPDAFRAMLKDYVIRRVKDDVLTELPGKQRIPIFVQMTHKQETVYRSLMEDLMHTDEELTILAPNKMVAIMRLRQLLVCPRLLGIPEDGAALTALAEQASDLLANGQSVVIFTPFPEALTHIHNALAKYKGEARVYKIQGGMSPQEFQASWQGFQAPSACSKVLLCTVKSGASFSATASSNAFFLGYEWDFNINFQAEDRLCRMGQKDFVNVHYMMHKHTVDEDMVQILGEKVDAHLWALGSEEQYTLIKKRYGIRE